MDDLLRLRPVTETDLPMLAELTGDPDRTGEYAWFGYPDPGMWPRRFAEGLLSDDGGVLVVARGTTALGFVAWRKIVATRASSFWNIGIGLLPEARGRGYGTESHRLLARYLFAHTQAYRIEADTELDNVAEQRALEKAGFTREGVVRGAGFRNGRWRDGVRYSILRTEVDLD